MTEELPTPGQSRKPRREKAAPGPARTVAIVLQDPAGRVLLVRWPPGIGRWRLPGGAVAEDESPFVATRRLVAARLGIEVEPALLLTEHWIPSRPGRRGGLTAALLGETLTVHHLAAVTPNRAAVASWRMLDHARACDLLPNPIAARIPGARGA